MSIWRWIWAKRPWGVRVRLHARQLEREAVWLAENKPHYERARAATESVAELRAIVEAARSAWSLLECVTNETTPQHGGVIVGEARAKLEGALEDWVFAAGYETREAAYKAMIEADDLPDLGLGSARGETGA